MTLSAQPKSTFEFTGKDVTEAPNAPFWSKCAEAGSTAVGGYISQAFGAIFNDTDITLSASLASVTKGNLAKLRKECKARVADTVLALAPDQYADALALFDSNVIGDSDAIRDGQVKKLYGFKSCVELRDLPEGIKGALIPATAVAVASRAVRVADEDCYSEYGTASDENGFTLTVLKHGTPRTGKGYINMTTLFGFGLVQPDKIVLLK